MKDSQCYISIEIEDDLAVDKPLAEISRLLRSAADRIETFKEDQDFDESFMLHISRRRAGQVDIHVLEQATP